MSGTEESHAPCSMSRPSWSRRCGALSPGSEASAVVQRELGASLHRHQVEVLAMTVDEAGSAPVFGEAQRTAPSTAISKRLRSETSVTVGGIAFDCAFNVIVPCFDAASGQFDGAATSSRRAASLLAAVKSPSRPRSKAV